MRLINAPDSFVMNQIASAMGTPARRFVLTGRNRRTAVSALRQRAFPHDILTVQAFAVRTEHSFSGWLVNRITATIPAFIDHLDVRFLSLFIANEFSMFSGPPLPESVQAQDSKNNCYDKIPGYGPCSGTENQQHGFPNTYHAKNSKDSE